MSQAVSANMEPLSRHERMEELKELLQLGGGVVCVFVLHVIDRLNWEILWIDIEPQKPPSGWCDVLGNRAVTCIRSFGNMIVTSYALPAYSFPCCEMAGNALDPRACVLCLSTLLYPRIAWRTLLIRRCFPFCCRWGRRS
jgi:hypothetical protein